jgi:hypothetical protein
MAGDKARIDICAFVFLQVFYFFYHFPLCSREVSPMVIRRAAQTLPFLCIFTQLDARLVLLSQREIKAFFFCR